MAAVRATAEAETSVLQSTEAASPEAGWRHDRTLGPISADRSLIARLAAHESWARTADPSARTEPARRAMLDRFERQVDPEGVLSPEERARRAGHARKAYSTRLALRSAQARRNSPSTCADEYHIEETSRHHRALSSRRLPALTTGRHRPVRQPVPYR